jgi:hypothetical protein
MRSPREITSAASAVDDRALVFALGTTGSRGWGFVCTHARERLSSRNERPIARSSGALSVGQPDNPAGERNRKNSQSKYDRRNDGFFGTNAEAGQGDHKTSLPNAPSARRDRQHGNQQYGRDDQEPMTHAQAHREIPADQEKDEDIHKMGERGKRECPQQVLAYLRIVNRSGCQAGNFADEGRAPLLGEVHEKKGGEPAQEENCYGSDGHNDPPVVAGEQPDEARQSDYAI